MNLEVRQESDRFVSNFLVMKCPTVPLAIANYFIQRSIDTGKELTPMKLVKLVYIAHGWHLGLTQTPLINEAVQAWKYGPVIESLYRKFRKYRNQQIIMQEADYTSLLQPVTPLVSEPEDIAFLDRIWTVYCDMTGVQLSTLTHRPNTPWDIIWNQQDGAKRKSAIIPNYIIEEHYKKRLSREVA